MDLRSAGLFQSVYESPWHHPALFWVAGLAFFALLARRLPFLLGYLVLFQVAIAADALFTGGWSPLADPSAAQGVGIFFAILGDWRYFLLVERHSPTKSGQPARGAHWWLRALAWSALVPVLSMVPKLLWPRALEDPRWLYLAYELLFLSLALVFRFVLLPRRTVACAAPVKAWLFAVTWFEAVQYALWAIADVVILAGQDVGFGLRLLPNTLYYVAFLPFVYWKAPDEVRR